MKNKSIYIISGLIVLIGGYFIYDKFYKVISRTKQESIDLIVLSKNHANKDNFLDTFDDNFLMTWANAIDKKLQSFKYQGKTYNVLGGKQLK